MLKLTTLLITILLCTHITTVHSFPFGSGDFYEEECLELLKKEYSIKYLVKATNAERTEKNKYDFTPVIVSRGKETVLTRHFCEYYPEENMVYIGIAKSVIEAQKKKDIQEKKRRILADKKKHEAAEAASKHAAELQEIQDIADAEAAAKYAAEAAEKKRAQRMIQYRKDTIKAQQKAEAVEKEEAQKIIQYRKEKIKAQKKAETERIRREKYDPIAINCLKEAISSDFPEFKKTIRMPSSMKIGSNRTAFLKPRKASVLKYAVSEGAINIQYEYKAQLFYKIKRNGEIKDGYNTYPRKGSFICEIPI